MGAMASQIISLTIVYSTVYSDADQRKHQSSGDRWIPPQMASNEENFPFHDVIMSPDDVILFHRSDPGWRYNTRFVQGHSHQLGG